MRLAVISLLSLALLGSPAAMAEEIPSGGPRDSRVRTVHYDEAEVYRVVVVYRTATELVFSAGEEIKAVALGDSSSWDVAPSGSQVFLKPKEKAPPTNLIITTQKGELNRSYHFLLVPRAGSIDNLGAAMFRVVFDYPEERQAASATAKREQLRLRALVVEGQAVALALQAADLAGPRNLDYDIAGSSEIAPAEISDNGVSTILRFPNRQPVPAIFKVLADGSEAVVAYDVRGDFVVVHDVMNGLRLRKGRLLACIRNNRFDRFGPTIGTGTISPDVERSVEVQ